MKVKLNDNILETIINILNKHGYNVLISITLIEMNSKHYTYLYLPHIINIIIDINVFEYLGTYIHSSLGARIFFDIICACVWYN